MFPRESIAMRLCEAIGLHSVAWSLRRLHCPVARDALVLDVGSGGNPYPRANVLLDAFEDTVERYHTPLIKDRPIVFGLAERMPFKSKAFDFVIASHVLEHTSDPTAFIGELMRVGKAGYVETPDALIERLNPFRFHRLEVTDYQDRLIIYKKPSWRPHPDWVDLYERKLKDRQFIGFMQSRAAPFYTRFYWQDKIAYEVVNPEVDAGWPLPATTSTPGPGTGGLSLRKKLVAAMRAIFSQNARNRNLDLLQLLRCPSCGNEHLNRVGPALVCPHCGAEYPSIAGIPVLYPKSSAQTNSGSA